MVVETLAAGAAAVANFLAPRLLDASLGVAFGTAWSETDQVFERREVRRAFEAALMAALQEFARKHSVLAASFFDETFVRGPALAELEAFLTLDRDPSPARLAAAYASQFSSRLAEVEPACADFIRIVGERLQALPELRDHVTARLVRLLARAKAQPEPADYPMPPLPARTGDFTGREKELLQLSTFLASGERAAIISSIGGMGGVGKTTLAVEVAHRVAGRFPDGALFIDLLGFRQAPLSAEQALRQVLWAFDRLADLRTEERSQLLARYKRALAGKRLLLILDNARDRAHLTDLLPPEPVTVLVTSRQRMALPGAVAIDLDVLSEEDAVTFLSKIVGSIDQTCLRQLATACGCLPLALRAAGSYLWDTRCPIDDYLADLAEARLEMLSADRALDDELHVETVLAFSLDRLLEKNRALAARYVALSVFPADFDLAAAAAVWGDDERGARRSLNHLVARSLVERDEASKRFHLHDLLRDLAVSRMVAPA